MSELLFYGGLIACGVVVVVALIATILLRLNKIRLNKQLDAEYGNRRR